MDEMNDDESKYICKNKYINYRVNQIKKKVRLILFCGRGAEVRESI